MKTRIILLIILLSYSSSLITYSQQKEGFEIIQLIESTPIKNQQSSGTCWSFATTSFIETEAIRLGKEPVILSPIFYVLPTYLAKSEKYIRLQGSGYFAEGDLTFSVLDAYGNLGAIPEKIYSGIIQGEYRHDHYEMDMLLLAIVESVGASDYGKIKQKSWRKSIEATLKAYLGDPPESFIYENKSYTPLSFAKEKIGINQDDYIELTSYNHHPFYKRSILEIPANWNSNYYLNLPISDFKKVIDYALNKGYSICWDGDVTESGFISEKGIAELSGRFKDDSIITQEMRQSTFDNFTTEDNHNMHLIGLAKDKDGSDYYILKNSDGNNNDCGGYIYMSERYLLLKTISVMVNRESVPLEIKEKLNVISHK